MIRFQALLLPAVLLPIPEVQVAPMEEPQALVTNPHLFHPPGCQKGVAHNLPLNIPFPDHHPPDPVILEVILPVPEVDLLRAVVLVRQDHLHPLD